MAHFAKLGVGNIVEKVEVVSDDIATTEQAGVEFLQNLYGDRAVWKQTSYNTRKGVYHDANGNPATDQSKAFRKNYAGRDYIYDQTRDAFIGQKPFDSWIFNETTCSYEAPIPMPELTQEQIDNRNFYRWNETNQTWDLVDNL